MVLEVAAAHHCLAASAFLAQATLSSQLSYPAVTSNACASRERVVEHSVMSTPFAPMHHHSNRHDLMSHRSTHIRLRTGTSVRLDALKPKPGRSLCLSHAVLTLEHAFHTHVSMTWTRGDAESAPVLLIVMSDQRAHPDRLQEYAVRMDIEQSFKDDKSGSFDIDHTRLFHPDRLERLLLAVAIATLWCHEVGQFVLFTGEAMRRLIDPAYSRELSVFQLGLRWINRCLAVLLDSLPHLYLYLLPFDPPLPPVLKT